MPPALHVPLVPAIVSSWACVTVTLPLVSAPFRSNVTAAGPETRLLPESKTSTCQFTCAGGVGDLRELGAQRDRGAEAVVDVDPRVDRRCPIAASAGRLPPIFIVVVVIGLMI